MDGFTFFKSYYESAQHLSDKDQAQFYKLIMDYMFTGEEPQLQGHLMGFWLLTKPNLDTSKSRAKAGQAKSKPNQKKNKPKSKSKPSPLEEKDKDKDKERDNTIVEIISFLNTKANKNFKANSKTTTSHINARLKEGYSLEDFKSVISKKTLAWSKDKKMSVFIRPETLFGTKFDSYLNEVTTQDTFNLGDKKYDNEEF